MSAQCLSVLGPCANVCDICQKSYDDYVENARKKIIEETKRNTSLLSIEELKEIIRKRIDG